MSLSEEQVAARSRGIGGSDAPVLLGLVKYKTPVQLWLEKSGRATPDDISDQFNIRMGHLLEPIVAQLFTEQTGKAVRRVNQTRIHKRHPFILGNIDRDVVGESAGLECKAWSGFVSKDWGESGSSDVPLAVVAQCAHYMEVFDYERWYVGVLLGGADFRWFVLERDETTTDRLVRIEAEFWGHVLDGTPPPIVNADDVAALYPKGEGYVRADTNVARTVAELQDVKGRLAELTLTKERLELEIKTFLGNASDLWPADGIKPIVTWRTTKDRTAIDWEKVARKLAWLGKVEQAIDGVVRDATSTKPGPRHFLVK